MSPAQASSLGLVSYLALFAGVAIVFLFVNLLVGRFVRPANPYPEKQEIYECGEPTIGSSFVQFDLRFYVVALVFIIFDVEAAFFFPWAPVFGKTSHLADSRLPVAAAGADGTVRLTDDARLLYRELGVRNPVAPAGVSSDKATEIIRQSARQLAWITIVDIGLFFAVLLVGFAYVWKRGDLDWVRAVSRERTARGSAGQVR
jgi:NADH-quinone oxidoreductase subunit A